jgi:DNA-binding CsgD family transcriptional regulator
LLVGLAHIIAPICDATPTSEVQDWIRSTADGSVALAIVETAEKSWELDGLVEAFSSADRRAPVLAIVPAARLLEYASKYAAIDGIKLLPSVISSDALLATVRLQIGRPGPNENLNPAALLATLTPRQLRILVHLCRAESTKRIAELLNISVRTVEFHKYRMMKILGVGSTTELVLRGVAAGMGGEPNRHVEGQTNAQVAEPSRVGLLYSRAHSH